MGSSKKHKKHKDKDRDREKKSHDETASTSFDQRPLKLVLKVGSTSTTVEGSPSRIPITTIPEVPPQVLDTPPLPILIDQRQGHDFGSLKKAKKKKSKKKHKKHSHHHHRHHHHSHHKHKSTCHRAKTSSHSSSHEVSVTDAPVSAIPATPSEFTAITDPVAPIAISIPVDEAQEIEKMDTSSHIEVSPKSPYKVSLKSGDPNLYYNFLMTIVKTLQKRDSHDFFAWPVTDTIAPGYSTIICKPMDFSTIRKKIESRVYDAPADLKADVKLMCDNAMTYNLPDTIYYKAAKKLWHFARDKVFTREALNDLRYSASLLPPPPPPPAYIQQGIGKDTGVSSPFVDITNGSPIKADVTDLQAMSVEPEVDDEDSIAAKILEKAKAAAAAAAERLSLAKPNGAHYSFIRQRPDGSTSLAIVGSVPTAERYLRMDDIVGKLPDGIPYLPSYAEPESNKVKPVETLNTGPFGSYLPSLDSSKSKLSQEETSLLLSTYGDEETGIPYTKSLLEFAGDSDYIIRMADSLLDVLTQGQHSKCLPQLRELDEKEHEKETEDKGADDSSKIKNGEDNDEENEVDKDLKEAQDMVKSLDSLQRKRLSSTSKPTQPSSEEVQMANLLTSKLTQMMSTLTAPIDVTDIKSIRKALGVIPKEQ